MNEITFENKVDLYEDTSIADKNKVKASDMNSIKSVVNTNYNLYTTNISNIRTALGLEINTYSTSTSYAVGDMVIYNNTVYECNTATSGSWNSEYWTIVPIIVE